MARSFAIIVAAAVMGVSGKRMLEQQTTESVALIKIGDTVKAPGCLLGNATVKAKHGEDSFCVWCDQSIMPWAQCRYFSRKELTPLMGASGSVIGGQTSVHAGQRGARGIRSLRLSQESTSVGEMHSGPTQFKEGQIVDVPNESGRTVRAMVLGTNPSGVEVLLGNVRRTYFFEHVTPVEDQKATPATSEDSRPKLRRSPRGTLLAQAH